MTWEDETWEMHKRVVKKWKVGSKEDICFLTLALSGEVGELANLIKKWWLGDFDLASDVDKQCNVIEELADISIYLELVSRCLGIDLNEACYDKLEKLRLKWPEEELINEAVREITE